MKIKPNYILRQIAGTHIIFSIMEDAPSQNGVLTTNNSGALLWRHLEQNCSMDELVQTMTNEYEIDEAQARTDVEEFLQKLRKIGCLEDQ